MDTVGVSFAGLEVCYPERLNLLKLAFLYLRTYLPWGPDFIFLQPVYVRAGKDKKTIHEIPRNRTKHYLCSFVEFVDRFLSIEATKSARHSSL